MSPIKEFLTELRGILVDMPHASSWKVTDYPYLSPHWLNAQRFHFLSEVDSESGRYEFSALCQRRYLFDSKSWEVAESEKVQFLAPDVTSYLGVTKDPRYLALIEKYKDTIDVTATLSFSKEVYLVVTKHVEIVDCTDPIEELMCGVVDVCKQHGVPCKKVSFWTNFGSSKSPYSMKGGYFFIKGLKVTKTALKDIQEKYGDTVFNFVPKGNTLELHYKQFTNA